MPHPAQTCHAAPSPPHSATFPCAEPLSAPFPWFGGKSRIAGAVWERLGYDVSSYVEPFFGSGAVLLGRPHWHPSAGWTETVNDIDGFVSNAWRAIRAAPAQVAEWADWPSNEIDLHARHAWLTERRASLSRRLEGDPDYYDAKIAGWWLWGIACWIGGSFGSGEGPWVRQNVGSDAAPDWQLVHLSDTGRGVRRKLVRLSDTGEGVQRKLVRLGNTGEGERGLEVWMAALSARLECVRVCCGDWARVVTDAAMMVRDGASKVGVFLDPPYSSDAGRDMNIYSCESGDVARAVREWCFDNGSRPQLRIALCGYKGEGHEPLEEVGWTRHDWVAQGGYANLGNGVGANNRRREAVWFSPHCLAAPQRSLGVV